jgi:hypothetical protein
MNLKDHILLWNHALIEIIDIRHTSQHFSDMNSQYKLPSSAFLLIIHGKAQILVDDVPHEISSFHILHGGKRMDIQFLRTEELLEYYLILYKATLSLSSTISIMEGGKDNSMAVVASKQFGRGSQIIYEYLGMKAPDIIQQKIDTSTGADGESVSFEVLAKYSGDYIFRSSYDGMADLTQNPIWNNIPAVKEGRLMEIDFGLGYYSDIYSLKVQLDYMVNTLLAAPRVK